MAVITSFLWGHKHGVYAAVSFSANVTSWCSRNDMQIFTSFNLYINIKFIAQWLAGGHSEILHRSDVNARRQKLCKPENNFKQTRVYFFYRKIWRHFSKYVTTTLRALFAWRGSNDKWTPFYPQNRENVCASLDIPSQRSSIWIILIVLTSHWLLFDVMHVIFHVPFCCKTSIKMADLIV